jgi:hypothetical protein
VLRSGRILRRLHVVRHVDSQPVVNWYGICLEYRPPGRPQFGGHIERYLATLMRRIHGLPGTTYSNPGERGKYRSETHATMTMAELERWIALETAGRYRCVHRPVTLVPALRPLIGNRHFEIEFLDPGVAAFDFTFG